MNWDQKNPTNIGCSSKSCDGNLDDLQLANGLLSNNANDIPATLHPSNQVHANLDLMQ